MRNLIIMSFILFSSCNSIQESEKMENWKNEIILAEKNFANMAIEHGVSEAFLNYAASDAVLMRNDKLIKGKSEIRRYFEHTANAASFSLTWTPDYVDVAQSGDMAYTYGKYVFTSTDSQGKDIIREGAFHTVWKRQANGEWKFVWD